MKWHKKLTIIASSAVISAAAFTSVASAETIKVGLMLKKGFPGAEPVNGMYEFFKSEVEKASGSKIKVDIVYGGALGKPNERLNQVRHGIIQMSDASDGNYASIYKDIQILSMPYLFPNEQTAGWPDRHRDGRKHSQKNRHSSTRLVGIRRLQALQLQQSHP